MENRLPPQNIEAEKNILGAFMLDPAAWDEVADVLREEDFYKPAHRKIFSAVHDLHKQNQPTDLVTISNLLMAKGDLEAVGGMAYLVETADHTYSTANIQSYAKIVREKSVLRKIIQTSQGFVQRAYDQSFEDLDGFIDSLESDVFSITENRATSGLVDASELVKLSLDRLENLYSKKLSVTGVPSGFVALDNLTAGFQPGELIIVAARPSMGKTAFSLNLALHAALKDRRKVAYFSIEMGKEQVMLRLLASAARLNMSDLRVGNISDRAWPKLINVAASISETALFVDDTAAISPFEIRAKARRMKARHGLDLIIVDYLQLMSLKHRVESREREVSEISKLLKTVAKELQIPVIALAQLNRGVEGRSDRRPMLSDLRESGSIEQDADVIAMLYREDYYDRDNPDIRGIAEVIIGKQRNGPTDTVKLRWVPEYGIFEDLVMGPDSPMPDAPPPSIRSTPSSNPAPAGVIRRPPNLAPGNA